MILKKSPARPQGEIEIPKCNPNTRLPSAPAPRKHLQETRSEGRRRENADGREPPQHVPPHEAVRQHHQQGDQEAKETSKLKLRFFLFFIYTFYGKV